MQRVALENLAKVLNRPDIPDSMKEKSVKFTSEFLADGREFREIEEGSLLFWLTFSTIESLEDLWIKSRSDYLTTAFYEEFVTQEFLTKFRLKEIVISVTIDEGAYLKCKTRLLAKGN